MLVIFVLAAATFANAAENTCNYGDWSNWSECESSKHCSKIPPPVYSYPTEPTDEWDEGREQMTRIMKLKLDSWRRRNECRASGTCPEFQQHINPGNFTCVNGNAGGSPCLNVDQLSYLHFRDMGYGTPRPEDRDYGGNDVWGWTDPQNGDEYAISGMTGGTGFVRVTDPIRPVPVAFLPTQTTASAWRDMKVIGNYVYIVSEARNHGLQVVDLTRLRGRTSLSNILADVVRTADFGNAHNIVANEATNFIYVVGATQTGGTFRTCRGGLLIYDVRNPLNPVYAGCFGTDGYVHDAQCVVYRGPDTRYTGREVCFCFNENSLTIVDVHSKSSMAIISRTAYVNVAYSHQGWVTEDHELLLLDDELDENGKPSAQQFTKTYSWDIRDLRVPALRAIFEANVRSIDHNQYIIGAYTFQGNYESGLRIHRINRANYQLSNVAYFDVFPSRTSAQFNGVWSVYPYFKSGNVLVNSIDYGLYVVKPDWVKIGNLLSAQTDYAEQTRERSLVSENDSCPATEFETKECQAPVNC